MLYFALLDVMGWWLSFGRGFGQFVYKGIFCNPELARKASSVTTVQTPSERCAVIGLALTALSDVIMLSC